MYYDVYFGHVKNDSLVYYSQLISGSHGFWIRVLFLLIVLCNMRGGPESF